MLLLLLLFIIVNFNTDGVATYVSNKLIPGHLGMQIRHKRARDYTKA